MSTYEPVTMQENRGRKDESLIDEAKRIQLMKRQGLSIPQIADRLSTNQQNVRSRLQLIRLTAEEQRCVNTGTLGMVNALKMLRNRDDGDAPPTVKPQQE
jgi:DNA-binding CsgD family transcriptional regulator